MHTNLLCLLVKGTFPGGCSLLFVKVALQKLTTLRVSTSLQCSQAVQRQHSGKAAG